MGKIEDAGTDRCFAVLHWLLPAPEVKDIAIVFDLHSRGFVDDLSELGILRPLGRSVHILPDVFWRELMEPEITLPKSILYRKGALVGCVIDRFVLDSI